MSSGSVVERFAEFVAILGRGPGRSRALTREGGREALGMMLDGEPDPHQVGAVLMPLRYRGEDVEELVGMVEAARERAAPLGPAAALDWPSYGSGRTRGAPWFLLSALAPVRKLGIRRGGRDRRTRLDRERHSPSSLCYARSFKYKLI